MPTVTVPSVPATFSTAQFGLGNAVYDHNGSVISVFPVTFDLSSIPALATINSVTLHAAGVHRRTSDFHTAQSLWQSGVELPSVPLDTTVILTRPHSFNQGTLGSFAFDDVGFTYLPGVPQASAVQAAFGTTLPGTYVQMETQRAGETHPASLFYGDITVAELLIDYTWLPGVVLGNSFTYPMKRRHGVNYLFFTVPYPNGYINGLDVTSVAPPPDGKHYDIVRPRGGFLATIVGNTLRVYGAAGAELANGVPMAGVDICRLIF